MYFFRLLELVEGGIQQGWTRDEVTALAPPELVALPGADRHLSRNLGFVYDEMTG